MATDSHGYPRTPTAPPMAPPPYGTYDNSPQQYPGYPPPTNAPYGNQTTPVPPYTAAGQAQPYPTRTDPEVDELTVGNSFSDKSIRHAFIRKVYLILMVQLSVTVGIICLFIFCHPVTNWVQANSWFYWISYAVFIVSYIVLICIPAVRRAYPWNFVCLMIFTLALSYMAATISSYYGTTIVLYALAITAAVSLAISLFAIQTKIDFTMCSGLLFALVMVLMMFGFACLITYLITGPTFATHVMYCVYGGLAALVFSLFLVFDTQMVVGGKNRKHSLSPEEYISGALQIYLDIVYLFLIILGLFGQK